MPGISVVIPFYNMQKPLARCLEAVAAQTLRPSEVIVVDDGSAEGVGDGMERIKQDYPISLTCLVRSHAGASAARNRGFAESKGEYVIFLDADVVLKKHALERLYDTLVVSLRGGDYRRSNPQGIATVASLPRDDKGMQIGYAYSAFKWGWKKFSSFPFDADRLRQMPFIHTTSLLRREVLPEKPFDESLKRLQDWDLYLTLQERGVAGAYIPEVLFSVETGGTMSRWLPAIMYQIPFGRYGLKVPSLEKYFEAEKKVKEKHGIN